MLLHIILVIVPRTLLGLLFAIACADGWSHVIRGKELFKAHLSPAGEEFLHNLWRHRLLWSAKATIDGVVAVCFLANFHAPLALLLILPTASVIILFQVSVNKVGIPIAVILGALLLALGVHYWPHYAPLLQAQDGVGPLASGR